ncbi:MAG: hypothetical protein E7235_03325 [Lachnospiraceae bacterium]|nr:hypothetical protein [Lachnospiraceae bacterium]
MKLYLEIIEDFLKKEIMEYCKNNNYDFAKIVENNSYQLLDMVRRIIRDDSLDDNECFNKIEKIVRLFEENGINTGSSHNF